jgi:dimethylamine monooxygenase subunit A
MKYLPFLDGKYSVAPGLILMQKAETPEDKLVFQLDNLYPEYLHNKKTCRQEDIKKYFCEEKFMPGTAMYINHYMAHQLAMEHPDIFSLKQDRGKYQLTNQATGESIHWDKDWTAVSGDSHLSLFDALCSQVQEDLAVCQLEGEKDWMAAIHLCAPNHWAASEKTGRPFDQVHAPVPGMEKTMLHYFKMLSSIVQKGPYTRFAWGISTDERLNHHPIAPTGLDPVFWKGRSVDADHPELFLRVERQNLIGFPDVSAFLFTIRTYFYPLLDLEQEEKLALLDAVQSMSPAALAYKGLTGAVPFIERQLL